METAQVKPTRDDILFFLDLETTGLSTQTCEITQIACQARCARDLSLISKFDVFSRPRGPISAFIQKLTGITPELLDAENALPEGQAVAAFFEWVRVVALLSDAGPSQCVAVSHNGHAYDLPVLRSAVARNRMGGGSKCIPFARTLDTLLVARTILPKGESKKLGNLFEVYCQDSHLAGDAHRADYDVAMMVEVYRQIIHKRANRGGVVQAEPVLSLLDAKTHKHPAWRVEYACADDFMRRDATAAQEDGVPCGIVELADFWVDV